MEMIFWSALGISLGIAWGVFEARQEASKRNRQHDYYKEDEDSWNW